MAGVLTYEEMPPGYVPPRLRKAGAAPQTLDDARAAYSGPDVPAADLPSGTDERQPARTNTDDGERRATGVDMGWKPSGYEAMPDDYVPPRLRKTPAAALQYEAMPPDYIPPSQRNGGPSRMRVGPPKEELPKEPMGIGELRQASKQTQMGAPPQEGWIEGGLVEEARRYNPVSPWLDRVVNSKAAQYGNQETGWENIQKLSDQGLKDEIATVANITAFNLDEDVGAFYKDPTPENRAKAEKLLYLSAQQRTGAVTEAQRAREVRGATIEARAVVGLDEMLTYMGQIGVGASAYIAGETYARYHELRNDDAAMDDNGNIVMTRQGAGKIESATKAVGGAIVGYFVEKLMLNKIGGSKGLAWVKGKAGFKPMAQVAAELGEKGVPKILPSAIRTGTRAIRLPAAMGKTAHEVKRLLRGSGVHGLGGEMVEEGADQISDAVFNLTNQYDAASPANLWTQEDGSAGAIEQFGKSVPDMLLSMGLLKGGARALSVPFNMAEARRKRGLLDRAFEKAPPSDGLKEFARVAPDMALTMTLLKGGRGRTMEEKDKYLTSTAVYLAYNANRHKQIRKALIGFGYDGAAVNKMSTDERIDALHEAFDRDVSMETAAGVHDFLVPPAPLDASLPVDLTTGEQIGKESGFRSQEPGGVTPPALPGTPQGPPSIDSVTPSPAASSSEVMPKKDEGSGETVAAGEGVAKPSITDDDIDEMDKEELIEALAARGVTVTGKAARRPTVLRSTLRAAMESEKISREGAKGAIGIEQPRGPAESPVDIEPAALAETGGGVDEKGQVQTEGKAPEDVLTPVTAPTDKASPVESVQEARPTAPVGGAAETAGGVEVLPLHPDQPNKQGIPEQLEIGKTYTTSNGGEFVAVSKQRAGDPAFARVKWTRTWNGLFRGRKFSDGIAAEVIAWDKGSGDQAPRGDDTDVEEITEILSNKNLPEIIVLVRRATKEELAEQRQRQLEDEALELGTEASVEPAAPDGGAAETAGGVNQTSPVTEAVTPPSKGDWDLAELTAKYAERMPGVAETTHDRNATHLKGALERGEYSTLLGPGQKHSRAIFEELTGVKLPKGLKATKALFTGKPFSRRRENGFEVAQTPKAAAPDTEKFNKVLTQKYQNAHARWVKAESEYDPHTLRAAAESMERTRVTLKARGMTDEAIDALVAPGKLEDSRQDAKPQRQPQISPMAEIGESARPATAKAEKPYNLAIRGADNRTAYVSRLGEPNSTITVGASTQAELEKKLRERYGLGASKKEGVYKPIAELNSTVDKPGPAFEAVTPRGDVRVKGQWAVVSADDLVTSEKADFDQELQPRDRDTVEAREQVAKIAAAPDATRLLDGPTTDVGAPIVDARGHVISGNGRTMGVRQAYEGGKGQAYEAAIRKRAEELNLDAEGIARPMLVRVIGDTGGATLAEIAELSNRKQALERGEAETAEADAKAIINKKLLRLFAPDESGDVRAASNHEFLKAFISEAGVEGMRTSDGGFSPSIAQRVRRAILAALFQSSDTARKTVADAIENAEALGIKRVLDGIMVSGGRLLKLADEKPRFDITAEIGQALAEYIAFRKQVIDGTVKTIDQYLAQGDLFEDAPDAIVKTLLHEFDRRASMKSVRALLDTYVAKAQAIDTASGSLFEGDVPETSAAELLEAAINETKDEGKKQSKDQETLPGMAEGDREGPPGPEGAAVRTGGVGNQGREVAPAQAEIDDGKPDAHGKVSANTGATQPGPTFSRAELGAGLNLIIAQGADRETTNPPTPSEAAGRRRTGQAKGTKETTPAAADTTGETPAPGYKPPFTIQHWNGLMKRLHAGEVGIGELLEEFERAIAAEQAIVAELNQKTIKELKPMAWMFYGSKKGDLVKNIYERILDNFHMGAGISWTAPETYRTAVRRLVRAQTQEDIDKYVAASKEKVDQTKKAIEDPQTLEEFRTFIRYRGEDKLTAEQMARYDELRADQTQAREKDSKAIVGKVEGAADIPMEIVEREHSKRGTTVYIVTMGERVDGDTFKELAQKARALGGNWSREWKPTNSPAGFMFNDRASAEKFTTLREGSVDRSEQLKARAETAEQEAAHRLSEMADKMESDANERLNRDRQTNTARRAGMAESADAGARGDIAMATTLRNLAAGILGGTTKFLRGIQHRTQVEELQQRLYRAMQNANSKLKRPYKEGRAPTLEDIDHASWNGPGIVSSRLDRLLRAAEDAKLGVRLITTRLRKRINTQGQDPNPIIYLEHEQEISDVKRVLEKVANSPAAAADAKYEMLNIREALVSFDRLRKMGITDLPTLRAALREYMQFKGGAPAADKVKSLERGLAGRKIAGFFPTPAAVRERMMEAAEIEPGMAVLEPSAGAGNLADDAKAAGGDIDVIEVNPSLREILDAKGFEVVGHDFLDFETEKRYDRIVMNPPWGREAGQSDMEHVRRAYELLAPGGRLVAVMGEGAFFRQTQPDVDFRDWLDGMGGESEQLPAGSFEDATEVRTTGTATRLVTIDKAEAGSAKEAEDKPDTRNPEPGQEAFSATRAAVGREAPELGAVKAAEQVARAIAAAVPGMTVKRVGDDWEVTAPNGAKVLVRSVSGIPLTPDRIAIIRKTYPAFRLASEMQINAMFQPITLVVGGRRMEAAHLIAVADSIAKGDFTVLTQEIREELFHLAEHLKLFRAEEWAGLVERFAKGLPKDQQGEAIAHGLKPNSGIWRRIAQFVRKMFATLTGDMKTVAGFRAESAFRSGEVFARKGTTGQTNPPTPSEAAGLRRTGDTKEERFSVGDQFRDRVRLLPEDDKEAERLDVNQSSGRILEAFMRVFQSWPDRVNSADGREILIKNPLQRSVVQRAKHLLGLDRSFFASHHARYALSTKATVENPAVVLWDEQEKTFVYARKYAGGVVQLVVVAPDGTVRDQYAATGRLITQFPYSRDGRQGHMRVVWERFEGNERSPENLAPTPPVSTVPGPRQEEFQNKYTTMDGDLEGGMDERFSVNKEPVRAGSIPERASSDEVQHGTANTGKSPIRSANRDLQTPIAAETAFREGDVFARTPGRVVRGDQRYAVGLTPGHGFEDNSGMDKKDIASFRDQVLRDSLGNPTPEATLAVVREDFLTAKDTYNRATIGWAVDSVTQLGRHEIQWLTLGAAREALNRAGFDVSEKPVNLSGDYGIEHRHTKEYIERLVRAEDEKWRDAKPVYLRYGKPPKSGRSMNYADNRLEKGVSVLRGLALPSGEVKPVLQISQQLGTFLMDLRERDIYVVDGDYLGIGSDGEPVLGNVKIVRKVDPSKFRPKKPKPDLSRNDSGAALNPFSPAREGGMDDVGPAVGTDEHGRVQTDTDGGERFSLGLSPEQESAVRGAMDEAVEWLKGAKHFPRWMRSYTGKKDARARKDIGVLDPLLRTMMYYGEKIPALKKMFEIAQRRTDDVHSLTNDILGEGAADNHAAIQRLVKLDKGAYRALGEHLFAKDRNAHGMLVKQDGEDVWVVIGYPNADGKRSELGRFNDEDDAWSFIYMVDANAYSEKAVPWSQKGPESKANATKREAVRDAYLATRKINHRVHAMLRANIEELKREYEALGRTMPREIEYQNADGRTDRVDLWAALREMGDRRGYYMPRLRPGGRYVLFASKKGTNPIRKHFDTTIGRAVYAYWIETRKGYDTAKDISGRPAETAFQEASLSAINDLIQNSLTAMKQTARTEMTYKSLGMESGIHQFVRKDGKKEKHLIIDAPDTPEYNEIFMEFGGQRYDDGQTGTGEAWHWVRPSKKLADRILGKITESQIANHSLNLFSEAVFANMAEILHTRGSRSRKIGRGDATGIEVWRGYEEDLERALVGLASSVAGGTAKRMMAKDMAKAFTGTDVSWQQYKADNLPEDFDKLEKEDQRDELEELWDDYQKMVDAKRIDSASQPNAFEDGFSFMKEQLRNEDKWERIFGYVKGVAAVKYLTRVSSGLINLTALATNVMPAMHLKAGISFKRSPALLARAANTYTQYWLQQKYGKTPTRTISKDDVDLFNEIREKGWDTAQFRRDAIRTLQGIMGRNWSKTTDLAMTVFTLTEMLNRGSTVAATYWGIKEKHKGAWTKADHAAALQLAYDTNLRAHGLYTKANQPALTRGGGPLPVALRSAYTFSVFTHNYLQLIGEAWGGVKLKPDDAKAVAWLLLAPVIVGGPAAGIVKTLAAPVVALARMVFEAVGEPLPDDLLEAFYTWLEEHFGWVPARFARKGLIGGLTGIDVSGSLGVTFGLPDKIWEFLGAPASVFTDLAAAGKAVTTDPLLAWEKAAPGVLSAPARAYREYTRGMTRGQYRQQFYGDEPIHPGAYATGLRALGFNPVSVSEKQERQRSEAVVKAQYDDMRDGIYTRARLYAQRGRNDPEAWAAIQLEANAFNERLVRQGHRKEFIAPITNQSLRGQVKNQTAAPRAEKTRGTEKPRLAPRVTWAPPMN